MSELVVDVLYGPANYTRCVQVVLGPMYGW